MVYAFKFELDFAASFAFIRFMQSEIYAKKRREKNAKNQLFFPPRGENTVAF